MEVAHITVLVVDLDPQLCRHEILSHLEGYLQRFRQIRVWNITLHANVERFFLLLEA